MVYEYHQFTEVPTPYQYSRTYEQFRHDLETRVKANDIVRFDDCWSGQYKACKIAEEFGIRVVLGITTGYLDRDVEPQIYHGDLKFVTPDYMTWDQVKELTIVGKHIAANHTHSHPNPVKLTQMEFRDELNRADRRIEAMLDTIAMLYLPTYNYVDEHVKQVCDELDMQILNPVFIMRNTTV